MKPNAYRFATENDISLILHFIRSIAEYEKMSDEVIATKELLREWLFEKRIGEVIFAMENEVEVGFALFFYNYSTFVGKGGIHLEDLYVKPEYRKKGYGKGLLLEVAKLAVARGCGRMEWTCLDWNTPSIEFYLSIGAKPMSEWTIYRLTEQDLIRLTANKPVNR